MNRPFPANTTATAQIHHGKELFVISCLRAEGKYPSIRGHKVWHNDDSRPGDGVAMLALSAMVNLRPQARFSENVAPCLAIAVQRELFFETSLGGQTSSEPSRLVY